MGAYIDDVGGDVFLIRSTSADIQLKNVQMESYSGVLVHTVLNADSMGNFLAAGDGEQVEPVAVTMEDMDVAGDILHEDYQRRMTVDLEHTTLTGNLVSGTMESWNQQWADYGEVNWVVDDSFDADYGEIQGEITLDGAALEPEPGETYTGDIQVIGGYGQEPEESVQEEAEASEVQETIAAVQPAAPETPEPEQQTEPQPEPAESHTNTVIAVVLAVLAICIIAGAVVAKKKKK